MGRHFLLHLEYLYIKKKKMFSECCCIRLYIYINCVYTYFELIIFFQTLYFVRVTNIVWVIYLTASSKVLGNHGPLFATNDGHFPLRTTCQHQKIEWFPRVLLMNNLGFACKKVSN